MGQQRTLRDFVRSPEPQPLPAGVMTGPVQLPPPLPDWKIQAQTALENVYDILTSFVGAPTNDSPASQFGELLAAAAPILGAVKGAKTLKDLAKAPIKAYHGSPHDFDQFSLSKIGTGEGAQAYGHGLYFAENEGVAKEYRNTLSGRTFTLSDGRSIADDATSRTMNQTRAETIAAQHLNDAFNAQSSHPYGFAKDRLRKARGYYPEEAEHIDQAMAIIDDWNAAGGHAPKSTGRMYEVEIHADPDDFLDWDAPLSQQPKVLEKLRKADAADATDIFTPEGAYSAEDLTGDDLYSKYSATRGHEVASRAARRAGIPGIKYYDQGSRAAGSGTRNYVVFDDKLISIVKKYGVLGALGAGLITQIQAQQLKEQGYQ